MTTTEGEQLRDEGMARTTAAANPLVVKAVDELIELFNDLGEPWSANDIRAALPGMWGPLVGARVRAAATRRPKVMEAVGYTRSTLPSAHHDEIKMWQGVARS